MPALADEHICGDTIDFRLKELLVRKISGVKVLKVRFDLP